MEREIIEQEIEIKSENIITFPKDDYYTKEEVDVLLDEKADDTEISVINSDIAQINDDMTKLSLITETGSQIELNMSTSDFKMTAKLKDKNGNLIYTSNVIDLPLESVVVNGSYDSVNKKVILTLENGNTIEFSVADLVSGLQTEITSSNKLSSDLVDDTNNTHKFVSTSEKTTWNNKSDFSGNYDDLTNKPTIPTVPTNVSAFTNDAGYTTNTGTITSVKMNGSTVSSSGEADLGTVITDVSNKQDTLVSGTNIKTINNESILGTGNISVTGEKFITNSITGDNNNPAIFNNMDLGIYLLPGTSNYFYYKGTSSNTSNTYIALSDMVLPILFYSKKYSEANDDDVIAYYMGYQTTNTGIILINIKKKSTDATGVTVATGATLKNRMYTSSILYNFLKGASFQNVIPTITPTNFTNSNEIVTKGYVDDHSTSMSYDSGASFELSGKSPGVYTLADGSRYVKIYYNNVDKTGNIKLFNNTIYIYKSYSSASNGEIFAMYLPMTFDYDVDNGNYFIKNVGITYIKKYNNNVLIEDGTKWNFKYASLTDNSTISGLYTFNTLPQSSLTPTSNNDLVNKSYVDGLVGNINTVLATLTTPGGVSI